MKQDFALHRGYNSRFGFSFKFPSEWRQAESDNSDGVTISKIDDPEVEIRAWGGFHFDSAECNAAAGDNDSTKIWERQVEIADRSTASSRFIPARVTHWRRADDAYLEITARVDNLDIHVRCKSPASDFDAYRDLFETVCGALEITRRGN